MRRLVAVAVARAGGLRCVAWLRLQLRAPAGGLKCVAWLRLRLRAAAGGLKFVARLRLRLRASAGGLECVAWLWLWLRAPAGGQKCVVRLRLRLRMSKRAPRSRHPHDLAANGPVQYPLAAPPWGAETSASLETSSHSASVR